MIPVRAFCAMVKEMDKGVKENYLFVILPSSIGYIRGVAVVVSVQVVTNGRRKWKDRQELPVRRDQRTYQTEAFPPLAVMAKGGDTVGIIVNSPTVLLIF